MSGASVHVITERRARGVVKKMGEGNHPVNIAYRAIAEERDRCAARSIALRGIGRTTLMVETLPDQSCTVVVPSREVGREVMARAKEAFRDVKLIKTVVIRSESDAQKMQGLSVPIFFDHSFFDIAHPSVISTAIDCAIICSRHARWQPTAV